MEDIQISLCASANRTRWWMLFLDSLKGNSIKYEVIFVGDVEPTFDVSRYPELKYIKASVKPCQCYNLAFEAARGELLTWTADDADYNCPDKNCPNALDVAYNYWQNMNKKYNNDRKSVVAFRPIEDGGDVQERQHYLVGQCLWTPMMAPFGLVDRKNFFEHLGGYDKNFCSGQAENDAVMRIIEDGGRVEFCREAFVYVHHKRCHPRDPKTGKEDNKFRKFYWDDRKVLEEAWIREGFGHCNTYEPNELKNRITISKTRLIPFEPFEKTEDRFVVSQGKYKGIW